MANVLQPSQIIGKTFVYNIRSIKLFYKKMNMRLMELTGGR